jgi:hypothetical protein
VGWPINKDVLQENPEKNFREKSRMKNSRRKKEDYVGRRITEGFRQIAQYKKMGGSENILE